MTFLSLFSGIGGFDLAAYRCGLRFDRHLFSEIDPYAIKVFRARFPDAEALGDITKIKKEDLPNGDYIIAGGFPCQDISVAGKGAGLAGARSGLWFEMLRLIGDLRPRFVVVENVGALLVRGIDTVLGTLAEIGYDAEWQIISASSVGAPHRRERVYIVAYPFINNSNAWRPESARFVWTARVADGGDDVVNPNGERCEEQPHGLAARPGNIDGKYCGKNVADTYNDGTSTSEKPGNIRRAKQDERWTKEPSSLIESSGSCLQSALPEDVPDPDSRRREQCNQNKRSISEPNANSEELADTPNGGDVWLNGQLESTQGEVREHRGSTEDGRGEWWKVEPDVGRVASRLSTVLDTCLRMVKNGNADNQEAITAIDSIRGQVLLCMRIKSQDSKTPYSPGRTFGYSIVSKMPQGFTHEEWYMGARIERSEYLRGLWAEFYSSRLPPTQDLLNKLLEGIRQEERLQTMGNERVNQLKCLGNAIVPQCAEVIFNLPAFDEWRML